MTKKQVLRAIAFFMCVAIMVVVLCDLFEETNQKNSSQRFYRYRTLEENTIDAVMVGTSGTDRYWIPSQAYEKYGMTVYPLSSNSMPVFLYTQLIEEALAYQSPELIVIDIRPFTQDNVSANRMDTKARMLLDALTPFSVNRIKAGIETIQAIRSVDPTQSQFDLSFFFSVIKFHTKWSADSYSIKDNLGEVKHKYMGFHVSKSVTIKQTPLDPQPIDLDQTLELDALSEKYLYDLFDYIREKDLNVLFIDTPQVRNATDVGRSNRIYQIVEEEGFDCLHFYNESAPNGITIDFDYETEFYNTGHTNYYGAIRFTDVLAEYYHENYNFPDHRNDENVKKDWDDVQETLEKRIAKLEKDKASEVVDNTVILDEDE